MRFITQFSLYSNVEDRFLSKLILSAQMIFHGAVKLSRLHKRPGICLINYK